MQALQCLYSARHDEIQRVGLFCACTLCMATVEGAMCSVNTHCVNAHCVNTYCVNAEHCVNAQCVNAQCEYAQCALRSV